MMLKNQKNYLQNYQYYLIYNFKFKSKVLCLKTLFNYDLKYFIAILDN